MMMCVLSEILVHNSEISFEPIENKNNTNSNVYVKDMLDSTSALSQSLVPNVLNQRKRKVTLVRMFMC